MKSEDNMNNKVASLGELALEVEIRADAAAVWDALISQIDAWWPEDFYAGGESGKRVFTLEAEPGGRMFEHWEGGGGVLWGTVVTVEPQKSLQVAGHLFPDYGGPSLWYGTWSLEANGDRTRLRFSESSVGKVSDEGLKQKDEGWRFLCDALKNHVEARNAA